MNDIDRLYDEASATEECIQSLEEIREALEDYPELPVLFSDEDIDEAIEDLKRYLHTLDERIAPLEADEEWEREQEYRRMVV